MIFKLNGCSASSLNDDQKDFNMMCETKVENGSLIGCGKVEGGMSLLSFMRPIMEGTTPSLTGNFRDGGWKADPPKEVYIYKFCKEGIKNKNLKKLCGNVNLKPQGDEAKESTGDAFLKKIFQRIIDKAGNEAKAEGTNGEKWVTYKGYKMWVDDENESNQFNILFQEAEEAEINRAAEAETQRIEQCTSVGNNCTEAEYNVRWG